MRNTLKKLLPDGMKGSGKMIKIKNHKNVRIRMIQIIRALDLWFIKKKKQACNVIAKRLINLSGIITSMDLTVRSDKAVSLKLNVDETGDLIIEPDTIVTKTAKSVVLHERIAIKNKNTWHKRQWHR